MPAQNDTGAKIAHGITMSESMKNGIKNKPSGAISFSFSISPPVAKLPQLLLLYQPAASHPQSFKDWPAGLKTSVGNLRSCP